MGRLNEWDGVEGRQVCVLYEVSIHRQSDGRIAAGRVKVPCESYAVSLEVVRRLSGSRKDLPESFASRYPRFADGRKSANASVCLRSGYVSHRVRDHHGKLLKAKLAISILIGLHDRFVNDLL